MGVIAIYAMSEDDFSTNGLGLLTPSSCTVEWEANGMYELKFEQPIDKTGRWGLIANGCIVKAPVPVRPSPENEVYGQGTVTRSVYRVSAKRAKMYTAKSGRRNKVIARLAKGEELVQLEAGSSGKLRFSRVKGGQCGYVDMGSLEYARAEVIPSGSDGVRRATAREQLFRIYKVEKDTKEGIVSASAMHISYDLRGVVVEGEYELEDATPATAMAGMIAKLNEDTPFVFHYGHLDDDALIEGDYGFKTPVECMLDPDEGFAKQANAWVVRDNFDIFMIPDDTRDNGVTIRRGKNLIGVTATSDAGSVVTRIIPEGKNKDGDPLYLENPNYVESAHVGDYPIVYTQRVKYNVQTAKKKKDADDEERFRTDAETRAKMRELAQKDFEDGADMPEYTLEVDFVTLEDAGAEADEYAALQAVHPYDTVTVYDSLIDLEARVAVTKYEYDVLAGRYDKVTLGDLFQLQSTVYSYNIAGGISGGKIAPGTTDGQIFRTGSIPYDRIASAALSRLGADAVGAVTTHLAGAAASDALVTEIAGIAADQITNANIVRLLPGVSATTLRDAIIEIVDARIQAQS